MSDVNRASRRDFLKTGTAAGIALAGGLSLASTAHAADSKRKTKRGSNTGAKQGDSYEKDKVDIKKSAHVAGGDELKIALIGCGGRGTGAVINNLESNDNVKLIAVADAFEDKAKGCLEGLKKNEGIAAKISVPNDHVFWGFDAYQKAIAAGPDIVILATSPGFRPIHYEAAIAAGKHVFMEKPVCIDAPGFRKVMAANKLADEKNLKVVVGLQRRYQGSYLEGIKKIHDGEIGDLICCRAYWNGTEPWFRPRLPNMSEMEYQMRNWYHFVWLCGDHICEQHVHNLDVCNWAKGDHPVEANGMGSCQVRYKNRDPKNGSGQIYDNHFIEFTYKDGSKLYSQCRQMPDVWNLVGEEVHGTKSKSICQTGGQKARNPIEQEHIALVQAIRKNEKHNDGWHGATSSFTAVLGRMATYSGQIVKWDDAVAKGPDEMPKQFAWDANPPVMPDKNGLYPIPVPGIYKPYLQG
jgi:myo-inositol 2-dehydrogenase / D-chiro-inositol 1-dehydrogenase